MKRSRFTETQMAKLIITYNHTDAGEHQKSVSHIGCGASYIKKKKVV